MTGDGIVGGVVDVPPTKVVTVVVAPASYVVLVVVPLTEAIKARASAAAAAPL
jgi:hypothetical protein